MKKNVGFFQKGLLLILLSLITCMGVIAQSNGVSISIAGIEYDDPAFARLKESLQKNKNISSLKPGYEHGIATLSFNYARKAQDLWDELPQSIRQSFKISTINDNNIVLESKTAARETTAPKSNTSAAIDDDCRNCYFYLCKYDGLKSYQGKIYKAINYDEGTFYYNCDNGVVTKKTITVNGYGVTTSITTDTILMSNAPVGTTWAVSGGSMDMLGVKSSHYSKYTLVAKGLTKTVKGTTYKDVIAVNFYRKYYDNIMSGNESVSVNDYYARGGGKIAEETFDPSVDPMSTIHLSSTPVSVSNIPDMKGVIDPDLVGNWIDKSDPSGFVYTYKFYADGTFESYVGSKLSYSGSKCMWRLDGNYLDLYCTTWPKVYRQEFRKKNDPVTGKPAVVIQFNATEYRTYIAEEERTPWKN